MTVYKTERLINCRSLAGYACAGGVTSRCAVRCGVPSGADEADFALIKELGIKTVIDLRGDKEAAERPSPFAGREGIDCLHFSLLEASPTLNARMLPMWEVYKMSLTGYADNYARLLGAISDLDSPFLFHCFLGKDRTGILSALLLGIAGADREDILRDYEISFPLIEPFIRRETEADSGLIWEQDISRLRSDRENMERTLDWLGEEYNGISGYLRYAGLPPAKEKNIFRLMTEKTER